MRRRVGASRSAALLIVSLAVWPACGQLPPGFAGPTRLGEGPARAMGVPSERPTMPPLRIRLIDGQVLEPDAHGPTLRVYHFWAGWHRGSLESLPEVAALAEAYGPRGVAFVSVALDQHRGDARAALEAAEALGQPHWYHAFNIEHRPSLDALFHAQRYEVPNVVLLSPDQALLFVGGFEALSDELDDALTRYDPAALADLAALEAAAGMTLADAVALLQDARAALRGASPDAVRALQLFDRVPEAFDDRPEVLAEVRDMDRLVKQMPTAQEADWRHAALIAPRAAVRFERRRQVAAVVDVAVRRVEADASAAAGRMKRADDLLSAGRDVDAFREVKWVAENAPSSFAGEIALQRLNTMQQDTDLMARVAAEDRLREAGAELSLAESYLAADRPELARQLLQRLVEAFADTPQAATAAELLRNLP